jgi:hypothetical protein
VKAADAVKRGADVDDLARKLGVRPRTLQWWCWKLRAEDVESSKDSSKKSEARLVPVVVDALSVVSNGAIEIAIRDVHLRIVPGTDVRYVALLIDAVRTC